MQIFEQYIQSLYPNQKPVVQFEMEIPNISFQEELQHYWIVIEQEYDDFYQTNKFSDLNIGCQYLLMSLAYTTGKFRQFSKLVELCQNKQFYEALKYNNRKCYGQLQQNADLQIFAVREKEFFEQHFDNKGNPKNQNDWSKHLHQRREEYLAETEIFIQSRKIKFNQHLIIPETNDYQFLNYKNPKWIQFLRDVEGEKYNFASFNEEQQKWFPVQVPDQSNAIIGYSHICNEDEEKYFRKGLTDGEVNYLFLTDYENNIIRVKRYIRQEFPQVEFDALLSWMQLFLIEISFRNYGFEHFYDAIKLAIEGKLEEAVSESNVYYRPSLSVGSHYSERIKRLFEILIQVEPSYFYNQQELQISKESLLDMNNIVGIKVTKAGYSFIRNDQAKTKIKFKDLITLLKFYYEPEYEGVDFDIYFSLDPDEESVYQKKIYFPEQLEGTEIGEVLYQSDFILKQMSLGVKSNGQQVEKFNYDGLNIQPIYERDPDFFNRIFLKIGNMKVDIVEDVPNCFHSLTIQHIDVTVDARTQGDNGEEYIIEDPNNAASIFVNQFVQEYEKISHRYPVFQRLKEVLMANFLAKHMQRKNLPVDFNQVEELFQNTLIQNYKTYQSPKLSMNFETKEGLIEVSGGIEGSSIDTTAHVQNMLNSIDEIRTYFVNEDTNKQKIEMGLSRCSTQASLELNDSTNEAIQPQKSCNKCKKKLDTNSEKSVSICVNCQNKKCVKCQKEKEHLLDLDGKNICQDCLVCNQCNKKKADKRAGAYFYHNQCIELSKQSPHKSKLLETIVNKLHSIERKGDNNSKSQYFMFETFGCIQYQDYSGYVIGYHHAYKKSPTQINPKTHRITKEQAIKSLNEDFQNAETQVYQQLIQLGHQLNKFKESHLLLLTFVVFVVKDISRAKNLFNVLDYNKLYHDIQGDKLLQCQISHKPCTLKSKLQVGLEFFNEKFHKETGLVRGKGIISQIKKLF